jgi:hypothetical protein
MTEPKTLPADAPIAKIPALPAEAEEHAKKAVVDYMNACGLTDTDQIADHLMKLMSVTAIIMARSVGSAETFARLEGVALFVAKTMPAQASGSVQVVPGPQQ